MRTLSATLLLDARTHARLSQRMLAEKAGTSASAIAIIESGRRDPTVSTLERLLRICGMELGTREAPQSERLQLAEDEQVGQKQASASVVRARNEVLSMRLLTRGLEPARSDGVDRD